MILVTSLKSSEEESDEMVDLDIRLKYKSFASILNSIADKLKPFTKEINLNDYNLTKDYNIIKETNVLDSLELTPDKIKVSEFSNNDKREEESRFSKSSKSFISLDDKKKLEFGEKLHYLFEITDFKKKDLSLIPSSYQSYFEKFFNCDLTLDINSKTIYKEYEFIYLDDGVKKHGIIDLMLESDHDIKIIDYKLKHIDDKEYIKQLNGYKDYIKTKTNKNIYMYLYSIMDGDYKEIF